MSHRLIRAASREALPTAADPNGRWPCIVRHATIVCVAEPRIDGVCDAGFGRVRDALARNFAEHGEIGAAVAVMLQGHLVVDLWAGWLDEGRTRPWGADTLVDVFSVGKAMAALSCLRLVERGRLALDAPVARRWPEFAAHGKDAVTLRMFLAHQAGVPGLRETLPDHAMYDWPFMTEVLAAEAPWWEPGTRVGYHVNTFGFLVGELVRRASGESIGAFFRREIAGPLEADFHFGVAAGEDARIADYVFSPELFASHMPDPVGGDEERKRIIRCVYMNPPGLSGVGTVNTRAWRAAEMPSTNGHANARAIARIYRALAGDGTTNGIRLLSAETLGRARTETAAGHDVVLDRPSRFGLGFQLNGPEHRFGPGPRTFGHFGAGGSVGFADPDAGLAFGYTMNRAGPRWQNPRNKALIDATYAALA
jgi:CubicO group peptidase (beta-lactamase class C family)